MIDRRRTLALLLLSLDAQRALASVASGRNTERRSGVRSSDRPGKEPDRASKATKENRHREYVAAGSAARLSDREKRATGDLGKSDRRLKERNHAYDPSKPLHAIDLSEDFDIPTDESPASNKAYEIVRINVQCIRAAHIKAKLEAVKDVKTALKVEGYAQAAAKYGALSTRAEKVAKGTAGVVLSGAKWGFKVGYHHAAAKQQQAELACRGLKISYTGALWNELHEAYVEPVLRGEPIVPTLDFVLEQLSRALEPTARWLDRGVYEWIHRGSGWR